ncbi:fumarylacetoacetate hydrolase family protein [soil metagenome]
MKIVSFSIDGSAPQFGIVEGENVVALSAPGETVTVAGLFATGTLDRLSAPAADAARYPLAAITYLPPVFDPPRIFCIGVNYEEHRLETGRERAPAPIVFMRTPQSQVGHGVDIPKPSVSEKMDYEGEIAIVIGKGGRNIPAEQAMEHVFGYSAYNDVSIRDWQTHTQQWTPGKNFDKCGSFGPWLVTADEMPSKPEDIKLSCRLNGVTVQQDDASGMIFSIPEQIAYISTFTELLPGDVIATGTPGGVGLKRTPQLFMKPGDVVEVEVTGVGILKNTIV